MPTKMLAFGPLMYVLSNFMVLLFSGSGAVIGETSPSDGGGRGAAFY